MAKLFEGKDPFDDPFFTQPFAWWNPFDYQPSSGPSKQITIEELNPEDDANHDHSQKESNPGKELAVRNNNRNGNSGGVQSFSFRRVSYGGVNGMYYTCSEGRRTGSDGVVLAEMKEEDKTISQSLHTISRGIRDKGHSLTTKQGADGRVDKLETLHNLNEDELVGFEEQWKTNADKNLPGWSNGFNLLENAGPTGSLWDDFANWTHWGGWPFPPLEFPGTGNTRAIDQHGESGDTSSGGRNRITVPVE